MLDVVYSQLGPSGNHLPRFSPHYLAGRYRVVVEIARAWRAAGGARSITWQRKRAAAHGLARPAQRGGNAIDALWSDDFHHSASVAATGACEAYYTQTGGTPRS
ncbi:MAG: treZ [Ramlibacter sp.]|nr:treZ [Ramlibacter sp.]